MEIKPRTVGDREYAYSLMTLRSFDEDSRVLHGIATTPEPDHYGDVVESLGAEFRLPLPLLSQHQHAKPIGHVLRADVSEEGIDIEARLVKPQPGDPQSWADRLNEAWADIRSGLVRGLSIGFKPIEFAFMDDGGVRFLKWAWLELSSVTIPANAGAEISVVRSIDQQMRAASGVRHRSVALISSAGVTAHPAPAIRGGVKLIPRIYK